MISACQYSTLQARETRVRFPVRESFLLFKNFILSSPFYIYSTQTTSNEINVILRKITPNLDQASMYQTDNCNYYHARPRGIAIEHRQYATDLEQSQH